MSTATSADWIPYSSGLPRPNSKVEWISPSGHVERGTYSGGIVWIPEGSSCYVCYTPVMWRYV